MSLFEFIDLPLSVAGLRRTCQLICDKILQSFYLSLLGEKFFCEIFLLFCGLQCV